MCEHDIDGRDYHDSGHYPVGLDSSGRREYKKHMATKHNGGLLESKQKSSYFVKNEHISPVYDSTCPSFAEEDWEKDDNALFGWRLKRRSTDAVQEIPENEEDTGWGPELETNSMKREKIHTGILATVRITNKNLINMDARLKARPDNRKSSQVILQSEALSLFKGNFIRVLKTMYGSATINCIKSTMKLNIVVCETMPIVQWAEVGWEERDYNPFQHYKEEISKAFNKLAMHELAKIGNECVEDYQQQSGKLVEPIITDVEDINLDSIRNIKF